MRKLGLGKRHQKINTHAGEPKQTQEDFSCSTTRDPQATEQVISKPCGRPCRWGSTCVRRTRMAVTSGLFESWGDLQQIARIIIFAHLIQLLEYFCHHTSQQLSNLTEAITKWTIFFWAPVFQVWIHGVLKGFHPSTEAQPANRDVDRSWHELASLMTRESISIQLVALVVTWHCAPASSRSSIRGWTAIMAQKVNQYLYLGTIIFWLALTMQHQPQMITPIIFPKCQASSSGWRCFSLGLSLSLGLNVCPHSVGQLLECSDLSLQHLRSWNSPLVVWHKRIGHY